MTSSNVIRIITSEAYVTGAITFLFKNVRNPLASGETTGLAIDTYYNNYIMDSTFNDSTLYRTVNITEPAETIASDGIDFYPKNEGESATYVFNFLPTSTIEDNMLIMI